MNTNYEIMNYLNLTNSRLGKLYKLTGYNPLPSDFVFDKEAIKERLYLNQMQSFFELPEFIFENKKIVKKNVKNSIKNIKKIIKNIDNYKINEKINKIFLKKLESYLDIRLEVSKLILKEFGKFDFDERAAVQEIYDIDPVMGNLLENFFVENVDIKKLFDDLENNYNISYLEKMKLIETKNTKKRKKEIQIIENINSVNLEKEETKLNKIEKNIENNHKNTEKIENLGVFNEISEKKKTIEDEENIKEQQ